MRYSTRQSSRHISKAVSDRPRAHCDKHLKREGRPTTGEVIVVSVAECFVTIPNIAHLSSKRAAPRPFYASDFLASIDAVFHAFTLDNLLPMGAKEGLIPLLATAANHGATNAFLKNGGGLIVFAWHLISCLESKHKSNRNKSVTGHAVEPPPSGVYAPCCH